MLAERLQTLDAVASRLLARGRSIERDICLVDSPLTCRSGSDSVFRSEDLVRPLLMPLKISDSLYPYQRRGVAWLMKNRRALLADDMGLGKTAQAVSAVRRLIRHGKVCWSLVVTPRTLIANWVTEIRKWAPEMCVLTLQPTRDRRDDIWKRSVRRGHMLITSYEQLREPPAVLLENPPDLIIADEAHRLRRQESLSNRGFSSIETKWLWILSGTPMERHPEDVAVLMSILDGRRFSPEDHALHPTQLKARARPYILRRRKEEVLADLPDVEEREQELELTEFQKDAYYEAIRDHARKGATSSYLVLFNKLRSLCDLEPESGSSVKIDRICHLLNALAAKEEKAVVFSYLLPPLDELQKRLEHTDMKHEILVGDMTLSKRKKAVDRFRSDTECAVLLASSRVASEGLTLTEANHVIFINRWWNPSSNIQARDRVLRIGQTKKVFVWNFVCRGTVETRLGEILDAKKQTFDELIEAIRKSDSSRFGELFSEP